MYRRCGVSDLNMPLTIGSQQGFLWIAGRWRYRPSMDVVGIVDASARTGVRMLFLVHCEGACCVMYNAQFPDHPFWLHIAHWHVHAHFSKDRDRDRGQHADVDVP